MRKGDIMYGRGSSDDGYAPFACLMAVKATQLSGVPMPRIALTLECEEESGSPNLIPLLDMAFPLIQKPDIMLCMDSGALNYDQLWMTSSLRGMCMVDVCVEVANQGYHSGETGGIIPESFRIQRILLDRLDDCVTGKVISDLQVELPAWKQEEAKLVVSLNGDALHTKYNTVEGLKAMNHDNLEEMYLDNVWRPNLSITGAAGLPTIETAGNVLRQKTALRYSMRLCPQMDAAKAKEIVVKKLTEDVPYGAKVTIGAGHSGNGWCMKELAPWFNKAV
jgi:acetylornithine deacetylase/succinyl-diaminopimelate desuccinylase-like protein